MICAGLCAAGGVLALVTIRRPDDDPARGRAPGLLPLAGPPVDVREAAGAAGAR